MDMKGDCVNLGDDDIVKNTQFSSDDCIGSQVPPNVEPRVVYGSSQETGSYLNSGYIPFGSVRPPLMQPSQVSYSQQNAWPNYGPGYGSGVHPMHYLVGSGMYSPFSGGNFNGVSHSYSGHTEGGSADSFLFSQNRHVPSVRPNMEWISSRTMGPSVHEPFNAPPVIAEHVRNAQPHPLSTREPASSGGPWYCPRGRGRKQDEHEDITSDERQRRTDPAATYLNRSRSTVSRPMPPQPSELRHSPPPESAETQQGSLRSNSVDVDRTPPPSKYHSCTLQESTPSECIRGMQISIDTPSKSNTPSSLMQRKALREDEKMYLKEVKAAIAEGRVPKVTLVQDDKGNIVRYKSQFFNALKLAAHAVVQDAYIKVGDEETMNEIMEEVKRQFIVPLPLPPGMVESYLKGHYKRCRSEYHKFWIKNGDTKKPDGCKQAAWLQLIDYWKSPEGKRECDQNKRNATKEKSISDNKKLNSQGKCRTEDVENVGSKATGSIAQDLENSESLPFDWEKPLCRTGVCPTTAKNPMADISNELHKAVDTILSSWRRRCGSSASLTEEKDPQRTTCKTTGSEGLRSYRGISRTTAEVLGSLQRPQAEDIEIGVSRSCDVNPNVLSHTSGKMKSATRMLSTDDGVKETQGTFGTKASVNVSPTTRENVFGKGKAEVSDEDQNAGGEKEVTVLLSSDGSSDGGDFNQVLGGKKKRVDDITMSKELYTEEIEGWPWRSTETGRAWNISGKREIEEVEKANKLRQSGPQNMEDLNKKKGLLEETVVDRRGQQGSKKANSSRSPDLTIQEAEVDLKAELGSRSEEDMEETDTLVEHDDDFSEEEEAPVLPKDVVKRKLDSVYDSTVGKKESKEKGNRRTSKVSVKKQKGSQIDASILKKLEFFKRPKNSNPIKTRTRVWVLHPKFVGKVVAEANAGVNRKSRCVDSANELCKEGQQMISVVRVLYKNTPVMFDVNSRFPKQISYLDQAEGVPNMPILWCVSHLMEIPPVETITRMLAKFMQPLPQETGIVDSEFRGSSARVEKNLKATVLKESRRRSIANAGSSAAEASKVGRTVLRSANV